MGVMLEPFITWHGLFFVVAGLGLVILITLLPYRNLITHVESAQRLIIQKVFQGYRGLLQTSRGRRTFAFVLLNAIFHSGVFTWLGVDFSRKYGLGEIQIGLALLG